MRWMTWISLTAVALAACSSGDGGGSGAQSSASSSASSGAAGTGGATASSSGSGGGDADTWANYANGFFTTYCVECHSTSDTLHDFTTYDGVKKDAATIRCGVAPILEPGCSGSPAPKQFPISDATGTNPKPSDAERTRIVAWIDAGLPQ